MKLEIPMPMKSVSELISTLPHLASVAQGVYDQWEQVDGFDVELGSGGICQDVASAMASRLGESGFEDVLVVSAAVGENHVFVMALLDDGVYQIDISPYHYETGGGYVWEKKPEVKFAPEMVSVLKVDGVISPDDFVERYAES
ncbi:hypothetical protein [Rhizobium sp. MHM7A]|uniref:hypothetical protein n=1 Tax=Rhizobium sp. MHM7A TaxID=2583233 RepID=UPI001105984D|nr:hypothetical protein [Rhizobium sp. MHM7A]TLX15844.1 hypothetical protein FFR93_00580 [Rhizobium sp. MHM7A]